MKRLSPRNARKESELMKLARTCKNLKKSWFLLCRNGIAIHCQKDGEVSTGGVFLSRGEFESFVRFYEKGQQVRP